MIAVALTSIDFVRNRYRFSSPCVPNDATYRLLGRPRSIRNEGALVSSSLVLLVAPYA